MGFNALVVRENGENHFTRAIEERTIDELPAGDLLVRVHYSSLNYKDALSATGNRGVTRAFPHTPGIDAAGIIEESSSDAFQAGDPVIVTSYDLGMNTAGGFGQYIRMPAAWAVPLPDGLSLRESMIYGTAGFTAALCVNALIKHEVTPASGEILVTGSTGGVGSTAVAMLAHLGYTVVAVTGKAEAADFLKGLGAAEIISREAATDGSGRPLLKGRWAGAVDTVGGDMLTTAIRAAQYGGVITCCGLVASPKLETTVLPFILRGVSLVGCDSGNTPMPLRQAIWQKLATEWKVDALAQIATERTLAELDPEIDRILAGGQTGRVVVNLKE
ncbi:MAG: YhdH/YhfP family quinone oxidoreductase [Caldilineaceae bacterium]|nr:YhdH/YhfP family quinone oxidoreductase [Caldilineaceae bacterium]